VLRQRLQWIDPFALVLFTFVTFCILYAFHITSGVFVGLIVCDMNCFARDDGFSLNLACYVHSGIYIKSLHFRIVVFWLITVCILPAFRRNLSPLVPTSSTLRRSQLPGSTVPFSCVRISPLWESHISVLTSINDFVLHCHSLLP